MTRCYRKIDEGEGSTERRNTRLENVETENSNKGTRKVAIISLPRVYASSVRHRKLLGVVSLNRPSVC